MPLAIELAAARVRALSVSEILDGLHDRFRLLTGGSRKAVRRQQTLRASVDWSHAMLTEPEAVVFRRIAAFMGGFDFAAAQAVVGGGQVASYQVLDLLTLLVDKSLVLADSTTGRVRYRLLETVRQYALEKLSESDEADDVRGRHRDYYTARGRAARGSHDHQPRASTRPRRDRDRQSACRVRVESRARRHRTCFGARWLIATVVADARSGPRRPWMAQRGAQWATGRRCRSRPCGLRQGTRRSGVSWIVGGRDQPHGAS